jgi:hypothetical protein
VSGSSERDRQEALELREDGLSIRQIAAELGVPRSTVHRWLAEGDSPRPAGPSSAPDPGSAPENAASDAAEAWDTEAEARPAGWDTPDGVPDARDSARDTPAGGPENASHEMGHVSQGASQQAMGHVSRPMGHPNLRCPDRPTGTRSSPVSGDPLEYVLGKLDGVQRTPNGHEARCPAHDDQHASLSVARGDDGRVLLHCHAGCAPVDVCQALGLRLGDLFPPREGNDSKRIVATYDYHDADGELLFQVVRFDPKEFRQRRPDGHGGWEWKLGRTPRVLYRLPELLAASPDAWAFVAEGEKDADRLASVGLVATTCPQGAGKWNKLSDDSALNGRRVVIIADKDAPGRAHAADVAMRLRGRAADLRILELPGPGKDASDWFDAGGTAEQLMQLVEATPEAPVNTSADRPKVIIDTQEHRVVSETIVTLKADVELYQRGGILVRVIRDHQPTDGILRCDGSATIQTLPAANLRERLTYFAEFTKINSKGEEVCAHPPGWLVNAIEARAEWDGIRHLMGVSDAPILRSDGSIWQQPGYDKETRVLFEPASGTVFPTICDELRAEDAEAALAVVLEVVCDFPFESEEHKSAWVAALLTPLARFAFPGPSPLFLVDANVRGAGKGLLVQAIGHIVLGREMPVSSYAHDSEEMRKKITAIAIAGDRMILLDNLEGLFGNDALDRALTSTLWKDRILGKSEEVQLPLIPAWYATGNNVQVAADTARRIIHIRIDCLNERPEERSGFRHENLLAWIDQHRGVLLTAALTILSAYLLNGKPKQDVKPFGSFEGWSRVVREAIVWVGMPDPCLTRVRLAESADTTADALSQLIEAWKMYDGLGRGVVISELLTDLYPSSGANTYQDGATTAMRAAIDNLVGCPPGRVPTPRQVGNKLRQIRRRVWRDCFLDIESTRTKHGMVWRLFGAEGDRT